MKGSDFIVVAKARNLFFLLTSFALMGMFLGYTLKEPETIIKTEKQIVYEQLYVEKNHSFIAECTAYTAGYESCGKLPTDAWYGITASGTRVKQGRTIAADTRYLPFGTKVYIEGMGVYTVEDVGGDIKGKRIDIYFDNLTDAINFGRQHRKLVVL